MIPLFACCTALLFACCSAVYAQRNSSSIGIGAAINPVTLYTESEGSDGTLSVPVQTAALFVPLQLGETFRIEPQFGLLSTSTERTAYSGTNVASGRIERTKTGMMIGTGLFYTFLPDTTTRGYVGARVGWIQAKNSLEFVPLGKGENVVTTYKQSSAFYGAAIGGEYYLSHFMSLGMELGLTAISFGDVEYEVTPSVTPPSLPDVSQSALSTNALVFVRFYLQ